MTILRLAAVALLVVYAGATALAQQERRSPATPTTGEAQVNVDRLPLDLARLERQLRTPVERENWDGFKLNYTVEVFGKAPRLQFFERQDVLPGGPIPYGAPTHREMVDVMTPREYRAPAADLSSFMRWLQEKMK
jgi:hypothetical protein